MWSFALDGIVAVLLAVTIFYAVMLNRRLRGLRRDRAELERVAGQFEAAIRRAEEGLASLKVATDHFQSERADARRLQDDLRFLIERAEGLADRVEAGVRAARDTAKRLPAERSGEPRPAEVRSSVAPPPPARGPVGVPAATPVSPPPSRPLADGLAAAANPPSRRLDGDRPQSESERELLAALAAGR